jgi:hypothetical protein
MPPQDTAISPPPDPTVADAVPQSAKERVLGGFGRMLSAGSGQDPDRSPLGMAMDKEHQQRIAIAEKHYKDYQTYHGILMTGKSPDKQNANGSPADLTPEEQQKYETLEEQAKQGMKKVAGVNKDIKGNTSRRKRVP